MYASRLVEALSRRDPDLRFYGCAGPRMQAAGVAPLVDAASIAVIGVVEVLAHIPRIFRQYRKLARSIASDPPDVAILTDSPGFHMRLLPHLKRAGVPVIYFVAPQSWAWRKDRLPRMRRGIDQLLCIFPFEPEFFLRHGIKATYVGHPLSRIVRATAPAATLRAKFRIPMGAPLIALLPGSRPAEVLRHLPDLLDAVDRIQASHPAHFILALPRGFAVRASLAKYEERFSRASIQICEGETWDILACSDVALAASGTVTIEAAFLGTPMVTFYRVTKLSWILGKLLVRIPFYCMVNLVAGRRVVPELLQDEMTGANLAAQALSLLDDAAVNLEMRRGLAEVAQKLSSADDPIEVAASVVGKYLKEEIIHV